MKSAPALLGLLLLASSCTIHANGHEHWAYTQNGVTTTSSHNGHTTTTARWSAGDVETMVQTHGTIHLLPDDSDVAAIEGNGSVLVKEKSWSGLKELHITKLEGDHLSYDYQADGVAADYGPAEQSWFSGVLQEVVRRTPIGAQSRANRILAVDGAEALLVAAGELSNSSAREIYYETLIASDQADAATLARAADAASRSFTSSSSLEDVLESIAALHVDDKALTHAIVRSSEALSSSSSRGEVLETVASLRALDGADAALVLRSASGISSTSTQTEVALTVLEYAPADAAMHAAYIDLVRGLSSSSSQEEALEALIRSEGVNATTLTAVAHSTQTISSTSATTEILVELLASPVSDPGLLHACLDQVQYLSSSSYQEEAMRALLARDDLDKETLRKAVEVLDHVSSSSTRAGLQEQIIQRLLAFD